MSHRLGQPILQPRANDHPINHRFDIVRLPRLKLGYLIKLVSLTIHPHPYKTFATNPLDHFRVFAFATANRIITLVFSGIASIDC